MGLLSEWEAEDVTASAREEGKRGGSSAGGGMEWKKQEGQGRQRKQWREINRLGHGPQYLYLYLYIYGGHPRHFRVRSVKAVAKVLQVILSAASHEAMTGSSNGFSSCQLPC